MTFISFWCDHVAEGTRLRGYLGTIHTEFVDLQAIMLLLEENLTLLLRGQHYSLS